MEGGQENGKRQKSVRSSGAAEAPCNQMARRGCSVSQAHGVQEPGSGGPLHMVQGFRRERSCVRTEQGCRAQRRTPGAEDGGAQEGGEAGPWSSCLVSGHHDLGRTVNVQSHSGAYWV